MIVWRADGGARVVEACCAQCRTRGVTIGMRIAHARALLTADEAKRCVLARHRPRQAAQRLERLAVWALRHAPSVAVDADGGLGTAAGGTKQAGTKQMAANGPAPYGLLLDLAGCERLHRSTIGFLRRLETELAALGIAARVASAPTVGAAWALARYANRSPIAVTDAELVDALDPLPIEALRLPSEIAASLREVEIGRIGQLRILPRTALARRHGALPLRRLDQALGLLEETIHSVRDAPEHRVRQPFDGPVRDQEGIALATRATLDRLCEILAEADVGARRVAVTLERAGAEPVRLTVDLSRPTRRGAHLWALLRPRLEKTNLGFGVEAIVVEALRTGAVPAVQHRQWTDGAPGDGTDTDAAELLDTLLTRLGADRVLRPTVQEAHLPERALGLQSVLEAGVESGAMARALPDDERELLRQRPPLLLTTPERAETSASPDEVTAPSWIAWRGERRMVVAAHGPERILGPWWERDDAAARDYWCLGDDTGRWLWTYRDLRTGRWFVHGAWV